MEQLRDLHSSPNIIRVINKEERGRRDMQHVGGRRDVCTGFGWGHLRERDHSEDPVVDLKIILRWIFKNPCFFVC